MLAPASGVGCAPTGGLRGAPIVARARKGEEFKNMMRKIWAVSIAACLMVNAANAEIIHKKHEYRTSGTDEIAEMLTSLAFLRNDCGRTFKYFDFDKWAQKRGYSIEDFTPERKYWSHTKASLQREHEFVRLVGKERACADVFDQWLKDPAFNVAWLKQYAEEQKAK
jgi:hypothetical protein